MVSLLSCTSPYSKHKNRSRVIGGFSNELEGTTLKVAIIGAGITGPFLAWKLSQKGHEVTVFGKGNSKPKVCSGLLSCDILDFIPGSQELIQNQINHVLIHFKRSTIRVNFLKEFYVIDRDELDNLAASLAEGSGVKIVMNSTIDTLPVGFDRVIGCDGYSSFVRKELRLKQHKGRLAIRGVLPKKDNSDFVEAWPTRGGFIWKIPRCDGLEYGIISQTPYAENSFNEFLERHSITLSKLEARMVPSEFSISSNELVTICGDAAGLNKPWSGGGIIWGLTAALILVDTFPDFHRYISKVRRNFLPEIVLSRFAERIITICGSRIPLLPKELTIEGDFIFRRLNR